MIKEPEGKSQAVLDADEAIRKAKEAKKQIIRKENAERRKQEDHRKYMMGGIIVKYFPECREFEESELNMILSTALATKECQRVIEQIREENAGSDDDAFDDSEGGDDEE